MTNAFCLPATEKKSMGFHQEIKGFVRRVLPTVRGLQSMAVHHEKFWEASMFVCLWIFCKASPPTYRFCPPPLLTEHLASKTTKFWRWNSEGDWTIKDCEPKVESACLRAQAHSPSMAHPFIPAAIHFQTSFRTFGSVVCRHIFLINCLVFFPRKHSNTWTQTFFRHMWETNISWRFVPRIILLPPEDDKSNIFYANIVATCEWGMQSVVRVWTPQCGSEL